MTRIESRLNAFAERVDSRFDQLVNLIESCFRAPYARFDEAEIKIDALEQKVRDRRWPQSQLLTESRSSFISMNIHRLIFM